MAKLKTRKQSEIEGIVEKLKKAKGVAIASYKGLKVSSTEELRRKLRSAQGELLAVKKTLLAVAFKKLELPTDLADLPGSLAIAFSYNDEVTAAKLLAQFCKANQEVISLEGGLVGTVIFDRQSIRTLASLPSRQELLAKMVGSLQSPLAGMVGVLHGTLSKFVRTLDAVRASKA